MRRRRPHLGPGARPGHRPADGYLLFRRQGQPELRSRQREHIGDLAADRLRRRSIAAVRPLAVARIAIGAFAVNVTTTAAVCRRCRGCRQHDGGGDRRGAGDAIRERHARLRAGSELFLFAIAAGVIAPIVSASFGAGVLAASGLEGPSSFRVVWGTWWLGDALGAVLYAPALILLWTDRRPRPPRDLSRPSSSGCRSPPCRGWSSAGPAPR